MGIKLVFFAIILFSFNSGQIALAPASGDGTLQNPYHIESLGNLYWISADSSNWDKHYTQMNDIDAAETYNWFDGKGWMPIGKSSIRFTGTYDGGGYLIYGLTVNRPDENFQALFGMTAEAEIKNLNVACNVTGNTFTAGLVGYSIISEIEKCSVEGEINGIYRSGGLVGFSNESDISLCYSNVNIIGDSWIGGFAGSLYKSDVSDCYALGDVEAQIYIGGFTGENDSTSIENVYSTCSVTGDMVYGGLIGTSNITVQNSFWDTEISGQLLSEGGTGLTSAEMKLASTFSDAGWGSTIWNIDPGYNNGYPYFVWNYSGGQPLPVERTDKSIPENFVLSQNYPNPFNPVTTIKYAIPATHSSPVPLHVSLVVYNLLGQEVATLVNEQQPAGNYEVKFDASNLSSGVYLYKFQAGSYNKTMKMILMK